MPEELKKKEVKSKDSVYMNKAEEAHLGRQALWLLLGVGAVLVSVALFNNDDGFYGMLAFLISAAFFHNMRKGAKVKNNNLFITMIEETILVGILCIGIEILAHTTSIFK